MSAPEKTSSGGRKWLLVTLGILLLVASLGWLVWVLKDQAVAIWQMLRGVKGAAKTMGEIFAKVDRLQLFEKVFGGVIGLVIGGRLLQLGTKKEETATSLSPVFQPSKAARKAARRWQSCNVLQVLPGSRHLWNFNSGKGGFATNSDQVFGPADPLPAGLVARNLSTLFQPRLNIAWLPVEQVFVRVVQVPVGPIDETLSMIELQLEKLSPLPVTQMVWSVEIMPGHVDNLQTVIVTMMSRDLVEKFLGELETKGYLPHRLELPILDQLLATPITEDGAYIYPYSGSEKFNALAAWWQGGTLRNVGLLHVPAADNSAAILHEQLSQMAWSGELEGWLKGDPRWHLVADSAAASNWQPLFQPWVGHAVPVLAPLGEGQLAVANANRAARAETEFGMLPPEYSKRYAQEFYDRLWMRAVGAVLVVYMAGVSLYMAAASWRGGEAMAMEHRNANLARQYTNTLQLKAQVEILQNRQSLKFASLDCWVKTAQLLPDGITVQNLEFKDGKNYSIGGVAPSDKTADLTEFNDRLRKATINGQPMFESMAVPTIRLAPGGGSIQWNFSGVLARVEESK